MKRKGGETEEVPPKAKDGNQQKRKNLHNERKGKPIGLTIVRREQKCAESGG